MSPRLAASKVLMAGEAPLVEELAALCIDAGHAVAVFLIEDLIDANGLARLANDAASSRIALEAVVESIETKRAVVGTLDRSRRGSHGPIDSSALARCHP